MAAALPAALPGKERVAVAEALPALEPAAAMRRELSLRVLT